MPGGYEGKCLACGCKCQNWAFTRGLSGNQRSVIPKPGSCLSLPRRSWVFAEDSFLP